MLRKILSDVIRPRITVRMTRDNPFWVGGAPRAAGNAAKTFSPALRLLGPGPTQEPNGSAVCAAHRDVCVAITGVRAAKHDCRVAISGVRAAKDDCRVAISGVRAAKHDCRVAISGLRAAKHHCRVAISGVRVVIRTSSF